MVTVTDRDHVRDRVLALASEDPRIVAGAVVGSMALAPGDRWSDLDLTFAVAAGASVAEVLEAWTKTLTEALAAIPLFDVISGPSHYRVFLLPGCLQVDLSFTPAAQFGASGPKFKLLFGQAAPRPHAPPPDPREVFGHAVHHALRARFCIARGRYWHAHYWLNSLRDCALSLACRRRGLPAHYGRGFDDLPSDVLEAFRGSLTAAFTPDALLRALAVAVEGLLAEGGEAGDLAVRAGPELRTLIAPWAD